ncbi:precorrin-6y C5,15-methyltransferase (decarboxylating) subunit CbiE [Clostridium tarantellae]|uniref:Precorrin-6y C5,15-methyltransferase (Decarboxylating) subunit CbiE n=1 Tax=Clostridium tarantellae TaxID=39493 RepID=A0A6I1MKG6_9CLOT|nr:precorrin-6y C5,15-methyltransferase (decarboxylating) subunit CbiE [Clostridium tarantellae]MPQ42928.1 precorrin-6y C5,15-methyltransferase (decarboxylating) subunit CbiE [Clostridium tarantellae]
MIQIVGIGPGHEDFILPVSKKALSKSDLIIGFSRAIDSINFISNNKLKVKSLMDIIKVLEENKEKNICVIASGDPTFYGITDFLKKNLNRSFNVIPGISSFQYLTCKLNKSWGKAFVGSLHGREENFINIVNNNKLSIWLTDNKNTPNVLCEKLINNNIKCTVTIGENLSYNDEKIYSGEPQNLMNMDFKSLSIFLVEVSN